MHDQDVLVRQRLAQHVREGRFEEPGDERRLQAGQQRGRRPLLRLPALFVPRRRRRVRRGPFAPRISERGLFLGPSLLPLVSFRCCLPPPPPREELGEDRARPGLAGHEVDQGAGLLVLVGPGLVRVAGEDRARRREEAGPPHAAALLRLRVAAVLDLEALARHGPLGGEPHLHGGGGLPGVGPHRGLVLQVFFCRFFGVFRFVVLVSRGRCFFSPSSARVFLLLFLSPFFSSLLTRNGAWFGSMLFSAISSQSTGGL